ncbi:ubiquitin-conjugating enzyme/RWD-like protein [Ephemerocybe angulata]|uniref:E2 ubiquitin-conjugating enzyme n=1 Tax=Ephemerocybe angulata TaxID=980116 RepID=A0A8H6M2G4_9AGAR|nr:ubiquitin-conjugating enzyme/RWD-like protein [Tulosesus angulatus]
MPPTGAAVKRLMREINELRKNPPEGIRVQTNDEDMLDVTGIIEGPEGTPYAGGYFRVRFKFTEEFPAAPPKCWFATKLFHPNVGPSGEICVNTLKKDWKSTYGIGHILVTVKCLLIYPNPESALDEEAGKLLMEDYESYCSRAKLITSVHATPRTRPVEFDTPSRPDGDEKEKVPKASSSAESVASTSKTTTIATPTTIATTTTATAATVTTPVVSTPSMTATSPPVSTASIASRLGLPTAVPRKASSPAPSSYTSSMSLKSSSTLSMENSKDGSVLKNERHASPAPLSTADANVEGKAKMGLAGSGLGLGLAPGAGLASANGSAAGGKSMKRAATNSAVSGAEKRKKALKRL